MGAIRNRTWASSIQFRLEDIGEAARVTSTNVDGSSSVRIIDAHGIEAQIHSDVAYNANATTGASRSTQEDHQLVPSYGTRSGVTRELRTSGQIGYCRIYCARFELDGI